MTGLLGSLTCSLSALWLLHPLKNILPPAGTSVGAAANSFKDLQNFPLSLQKTHHEHPHRPFLESAN